MKRPLLVFLSIFILILPAHVIAEDEFFEEDFEEVFEEGVGFPPGEKFDAAGNAIPEKRKHHKEAIDTRDHRPLKKPHYIERIDEDDYLFERVFEQVDHLMDEKKLMEMCGNPEDIVEYVMDLVDREVDTARVCDSIADQQALCVNEMESHCSFEHDYEEEPIDDLEALERKAWRCPVDENALTELCMYRIKEDTELNKEYAREDCEFEWEDWGESQDKFCEQEREDSSCDKSEYIEQCLVRWGAFECPEVKFPEGECKGYWEAKYDDKGCIKEHICDGELVDWEEEREEVVCTDEYDPVCGDNGVTYSNACEAERKGVYFKPGECIECDTDWEYIEDFIHDCEKQGGEYEKAYDEHDCVKDIKCVGIPEDLITGQVTKDFFDEAERGCEKEWSHQEAYCDSRPKACGRAHFIESCVERKEKDIERDITRAERLCKRESQQQIREMERECKFQEREKKRCLEHAKKNCEVIDELIGECEDQLTNDALEDYIRSHAYRHCGIGKGDVFEQDHAKDIAKKLRDIELPDDVDFDVNEEVSELEEVSEDLEKYEIKEAQKGLGYKMKLFLGFAKDAEESEIKNLEASKARLETSIASLSALADTVDDAAVKSILQAQVEELRRQQQDIDGIIEQKKDKSNGLLQLFGLFS